MTYRTVAALLPLLLNAGLGFSATDAAQSSEGADQLTVASGTLLRVEVTQRSRLQKGAITQGRLLEPIYADNRLLIPSGAVLQGKIIDVLPASRGKRWEAKFHGDFTPLHEPVIEWTTLTRGDGEQFTVEAQSIDGAGGTLYFRQNPAPKTSLIRRAWNSFLGRKNAAAESVRAPQKGERLKRYFWSQMPLHPQYVEEGAQFEMTLTEDLLLPAGSMPVISESAERGSLPQTMWVRARLCSDVDSESAQVGDAVEAVVTQPVFNSQGYLVIPQDSVLRGKVTSVVRSSRWGHNGSLRFTFDNVTLPSGFERQVEGTPMALEGNAANHLAVDQEGGVAIRNERGLAAPLAMGLMSASAMGDEDGGAVRATTASNGFAIMGRLVALGTTSPFVGGSIGAIGTGRTVYHHWLAHGKAMHFSPDTEVVVEVSPGRVNHLTAGN